MIALYEAIKEAITNQVEFQVSPKGDEIDFFCSKIKRSQIIKLNPGGRTNSSPV
jgi:hypothetical protein